MSTATERRQVRNLVFKRSKGQCECVHLEKTGADKMGQCPEHIGRTDCRFVNKDNFQGEKVNAGIVIAICNSCYFKKHQRSSRNTQG